jgi:hypothetical protein
MEDASAFDLDWFWRGWFYTTDYVDMGVKNVSKFYVTSEPNALSKRLSAQRSREADYYKNYVFLVDENSEDFKPELKDQDITESITVLKDYLDTNFSEEERKNIQVPKYFYNITFEKPGGLVMPIIVEYTFKDGTTKTETYPAEVWRHNDKEVSKVLASNKEIKSIKVDPNLETADVDTYNNSWPREIKQSRFDQFKSNN